MTTANGLTPIHSALVFLIRAVEAARETTRSQEREIDRRMLDAALNAARRVLDAKVKQGEKNGPQIASVLTGKKKEEQDV